MRRVLLLVRRVESRREFLMMFFGQVGLHVAELVDLAALDNGELAPHAHDGRAQGLGAIQHEQRGLVRLHAPLARGK